MTQKTPVRAASTTPRAIEPGPPTQACTRRAFLAAGTGLASVLAAVPIFGASVAGPNIAKTAELFQRLVVSRLRDADGLCRSFLKAETLAPFPNGELFEPRWHRDMSDWFQNHPDRSGCLTYENAIMATGEFAMSEVARFRVTGDRNAHDGGRRAIRAILAVIKEGRLYMPGYLPKPFGGIPRARYSHEMSPDQYTKALAALHTWRPLADRDERARIDEFTVDAADFFVARRFRHSYRHRTIVSADTHHHALGLFVPLIHLAAKTSGRDSYLAHAELFNAALDASATNVGLANFNMTSLMIEGFALAIEAGCTDPRLPGLMRILWEQSARNIDATGAGFDEGKSERRTSESARIAGVATLVSSLDPQIPVVATATRVLAHLESLEQMQEYRVPGAISSTSVTSWLLAYWRIRQFLGHEF